MHSKDKRIFLFLKTLDLYVLREYLKIFICGIFIFCILIVCYNMANYQANFQESNSTNSDLYLFLLLRLPPDIIFILPLSFFLSTLYLFAKMGLTGETVATRSLGITLFRNGFSVYVTTLIISSIACWLNSEIIPKCNFDAKVIQKSTFFKDYDGYKDTNIIYKSQDTKRSWFIKTFENYSVQRGITIKKYGNTGKLELELTSERSTYLDSDGWKFYNSIISKYDQTYLPEYLAKIHGDFILAPISENRVPLLDKRHPEYITLGNISEKPSDILSTTRSPSRLTTPEILEIFKNPDDDIIMFKISLKTELFRRFSLPIICLLFVLIAVPIGGMTTSRKDVIISTTKTIIIVCFYLFSFYASGILANGGLIPPMTANSIPMLGLAIYAWFVNRKQA